MSFSCQDFFILLKDMKIKSEIRTSVCKPEKILSFVCTLYILQTAKFATGHSIQESSSQQYQFLRIKYYLLDLLLGIASVAKKKSKTQ